MPRWPDGAQRLPPSKCPHCGYLLDAASVLGTELPPSPKPSDLTVCFGCGEILEFTSSLRLKRINANTISQLPPDLSLKLRMTQWAVRQYLFSNQGH